MKNGRATLKCMIDGTEILELKKVYLTSTHLIIIRSVTSINFADYCSYMNFELLNFERIGSCWVLDEPQAQTFLSCYFGIFKHGTKGLEHLYT